MMSVVDPLTKVEAGLKGTGDKPIPLQAVHIRARLLDLAAQVQNVISFFFLGGGGGGGAGGDLAIFRTRRGERKTNAAFGRGEGPGRGCDSVVFRTKRGERKADAAFGVLGNVLIQLSPLLQDQVGAYYIFAYWLCFNHSFLFPTSSNL